MWKLPAGDVYTTAFAVIPQGLPYLYRPGAVKGEGEPVPTDPEPYFARRFNVADAMKWDEVTLIFWPDVQNYRRQMDRYTPEPQCEWMPSLDPNSVPLRKRSLGAPLRQVVPHSQIPYRHFNDTEREQPFSNNSTSLAVSSNYVIAKQAEVTCDDSSDDSCEESVVVPLAVDQQQLIRIERGLWNWPAMRVDKPT